MTSRLHTRRCRRRMSSRPASRRVARRRCRRDKRFGRVHPSDVRGFVHEILGADLHAKRVESLANATTGVIHAGALGVNAIGRALAMANGTASKHGIKQVDRLLSNTAIEPAALFGQWAQFVLAERTEARIALDWTHFDADRHSTIAAYLITSHGRATPLVWRTFPDAELTEGGRTDAEDLLLLQLREVLPPELDVILLADRGFADVELYSLLDRWGWDYVIRFRKGTYVTNWGSARSSKNGLRPKGTRRRFGARASRIRDIPWVRSLRFERRECRTTGTSRPA